MTRPIPANITHGQFTRTRIAYFRFVRSLNHGRSVIPATRIAASHPPVMRKTITIAAPLTYQNRSQPLLDDPTAHVERGESSAPARQVCSACLVPSARRRGWPSGTACGVARRSVSAAGCGWRGASSSSGATGSRKGF